MARTTTFLFGTALRSDFLFWAGASSLTTFIRSILGTPPEVVASAPPKSEHACSCLEHILPIGPRRAGLLNDAVVVVVIAPLRAGKDRAPTLAISAADDVRHVRRRSLHGRACPTRPFIGYPRGGHMLVGRNAAGSAEVAAFLKNSAKF